MALALKKSAKAAALGALGTGAFTAYSWKAMNRPLPKREELDAYLEWLTGVVEMPEIRTSYREEVLQAHGNGLRLYHFESQPGDPAVVFIPGTSVYALLYGEFMLKLSRAGFNVIGFDPRGHGMSGGYRGVYTLGELVDDARAVIAHVTKTYGDRIALAGSSQGGMAAFYTAAAEPRLKAAICHNVIAPDEPDNYRMTRWPEVYKVALALMPLTRAIPQPLLKHMMTPVSLYLDLGAEPCRFFPDVARFLKEDPMAVNHVSLAALISLATTPLARPVEEIETPVMVIHAAQDNIFPEDYVRRVFDRLTCRKEWLYMPDAPHLVMTNFVDDILPPIVEWLKQTL